ncbi:hypothetical protein [Nocardioides sp.]|uniref:hypothetical protein n=1 Tax=Nocardioides sp. TaxID=35761 RepID=UPI003563FF6D
MSYRLSRLMSTASAGYAGFALANPRHLGEAMQVDSDDLTGYDLLAQTYGARDLAISSLGIFGRSGKTVKAAMLARIAFDLGDAAVLSRRTDDEDVRRKVLAVTLGWAALNTLALLVDSARADD